MAKDHPSLTPKDLETVEKKNIFNLLKKANEGKPLTKAEQRTLAAAASDKSRQPRPTDAEARKIANFDPIVEKGLSIHQLREILNQSLEQANPELALNARKELNKVQNLYPNDTLDPDLLKLLSG